MDPKAIHEKQSVALNSLFAAVFLTGIKLVVGFLSGSLGILAEAAHSGLDFLAAFVTFLAVRMASRPADREHPYGHGKIENISAMVEVILLLATCVWVISEAIRRLAKGNVHVDASWWAFGVVILAIFVDVTRSRMLYAAAKKHRSQALEADALHFSSDIWSSAVVLLGLLGVKLADWFSGLHWLRNADAVAALFVAGLVVIVSVRLGARTVKELLDTAPTGMSDKVKEVVEAVEGVYDCHAVRIRQSGPDCFVDLHVLLDGGQTLDSAHNLTDRIERAVQCVLPEADVTVHPEPGIVTKVQEPKNDESSSSGLEVAD